MVFVCLVIVMPISALQISPNDGCKCGIAKKFGEKQSCSVQLRLKHSVIEESNGRISQDSQS
jgi:hypothetical protein